MFKSILSRISILILSIGAIPLFVSIYFVQDYLSNKISELTLSNQNALLTTFTDAIRNDFLTGNHPFVARRCSRVSQSNSNLVSVVIVAEDGTLVCDTSNQREDSAEVRKLTSNILFMPDGQSAGKVEFSFDMTAEESLGERIVAILYISGLLLFSLQITVLIPGVRGILRPLHRLITKIEILDDEDFTASNSETVLQKFSEELNSLPTAKLAEEVEKIQKAVQKMSNRIVSISHEAKLSFRNAEVGKFAAHVSHDMRAVLGIFERLLNSPENTVGLLKPQIREGLFRLHTMVDSMRRGDVEGIVRPQIGTLSFEYGYESLISKARTRKVSLTVPTGKYFNLPLDISKFERAWMNLVSNAIEFAKSKVTVSLDVQDLELSLRVVDDGPGVNLEILPRLFERGATKGKLDGTGLGLAYVRQIMRGHGGDVVYRRESDMTVFECKIPLRIVYASKIKDPFPSHSTEAPRDAQSKKYIVSICFRSEDLCNRVYNRFLTIEQGSYSFVIGFDRNSKVVLTDSEDVVEEASITGIRPILMNMLSDDEIVRRAPIRLGIKG